MCRKIELVVIAWVIGIAAAATGVVNIYQAIAIVIDVVGTLEENTSRSTDYERVNWASDPVGDVLVGGVRVIDVTNIFGIGTHPKLLRSAAGGVVLQVDGHGEIAAGVIGSQTVVGTVVPAACAAGGTHARDARTKGPEPLFHGVGRISAWHYCEHATAHFYEGATTGANFEHLRGREHFAHAVGRMRSLGYW